MAAFPQEPVLFLAGLSLWLGITTFIASLLRYFHAYGAVLAGYTIGLIAFAAVEHPNTTMRAQGTGGMFRAVSRQENEAVLGRMAVRLANERSSPRSTRRR